VCRRLQSPACRQRYQPVARCRRRDGTHATGTQGTRPKACRASGKKRVLTTMDRPRPEALIEVLKSTLGSAVLTGEEIPARNEQDWSTLASLRPLAVIRPTTPEGVSMAMRLCHAHRVPVV